MARLLIKQNGALVFSPAYALQFTYTDNTCTGNANQAVNCDFNFFTNDLQHRSAIASDVDGDGRTDLTFIVMATTDTGCSPGCPVAPPISPQFNPKLGEADALNDPNTPNVIDNVSIKSYWYQFVANGTSWPAGAAAPILNVKQYWSQPTVSSGLPSSTG